MLVFLNCLEESLAISSAVSRPRRVTARAVSFKRMGIVISGVLRGNVLEVIKNPAIILPQARRLRGLVIEGLFSLIGIRGLKRGYSINTK